MILRQFSSNQPYLLFVLPFLNLLVFAPCLFGYVIPEVPQQFPFDIINLECVLTPWLGAGIAWVVITLGAILFNGSSVTLWSRLETPSASFVS